MFTRYSLYDVHTSDNLSLFLFFNTEYSTNDVIFTPSLNFPPHEGDEKALPSG